MAEDITCLLRWAVREPSSGAFLDTPFPGLHSSVCEAWLCGGPVLLEVPLLLLPTCSLSWQPVRGHPDSLFLASAHTLEAERPGIGHKQHGRREIFFLKLKKETRVKHQLITV